MVPGVPISPHCLIILQKPFIDNGHFTSAGMPIRCIKAK